MKTVFWGCCIFTLLWQVVFFQFSLIDRNLWSDQIKFFLNQDPKLFDFYLAYGHPGTTLVSLGCLFHWIFGSSFGFSLTLSLALFHGLAVGACSSLCFMMHPRRAWWLTTAFILNFNRLYIIATPTTATVMPLVCLLVVSAFWLWEHPRALGRWFFSWGVVWGVAAATRLDVSLLVGTPIGLMLSYRAGLRVFALAALGAAFSFFVFDPFLWYMPIQHATDLVSKFTRHYSSYSTSVSIRPMAWLQGVPFAVLSIGWFLRLFLKRKLGGISPPPVVFALLALSLLSTLLLLSSKYQAIRYLYPLIIVWEILLPLWMMVTFCCEGDPWPMAADGALVFDKRTTLLLLGFVIPAQIVGYFLTFFSMSWFSPG